MKLLATTLLLVPLALATTSPTSTISQPSTTTSPTSSITDHPDLELRQVAAGLLDPNAQLTNNAAAGAVTNYNINSQVGPSAAEYVAVVYTQKFSAVPDQWPSAKAGEIGMGDHAKRMVKRGVEALPTAVQEARVVQSGIAGFVEQAVVVKMVTELITVPVRRVTSVIVVETVTMSNSSSMANGTASETNGTAAASIGVGTSRPLFTATG